MVVSPEQLRGRLRDASATKGEAVLTVRRGERVSEIWVDLAD